MISKNQPISQRSPVIRPKQEAEAAKAKAHQLEKKVVDLESQLKKEKEERSKLELHTKKDNLIFFWDTRR